MPFGGHRRDHQRLNGGDMSKSTSTYRDETNRSISRHAAAVCDPDTWVEEWRRRQRIAAPREVEDHRDEIYEPIHTQRSTRTRHDDRNGDKVWFRARRIFHTDDGWYVGSREGNLGPYPDRQLAAIGTLRQRIETGDGCIALVGRSLPGCAVEL